MELSEVEQLPAEYSSQDVDELTEVTMSILASSPAGVIRFGKVPSQELRNWARTTLVIEELEEHFQMKRLSSMLRSDELPSVPLAECLVVRDLGTARSQGEGTSVSGQIVAHADYRFAPSFGVSEQFDERADNDLSKTHPNNMCVELHEKIFESVKNVLQRAFRGLPCFELHEIATLTPRYLRKGIAKRLVEWVYPYADQFGLPVVLCASPVGRMLYEKCGFMVCPEYKTMIDLETYGGQGVHRHTTMIRWPKRTEQLPDVWKEWRTKHHIG